MSALFVEQWVLVRSFICSAPRRRLSSQCSRVGLESFSVQGLGYEQETQRMLKERFNIDAILTGGAGDRGIDWRGVWRASSLEIGCYGQCKRIEDPSKKLPDRHMRELIGSLAHLPLDKVGFKVSTSEMSPQCLKTFLTASRPLVHVTFAPRDGQDSLDHCAELAKHELTGIRFNYAFQKRYPHIHITKPMQSCRHGHVLGPPRVVFLHK